MDKLIQDPELQNLMKRHGIENPEIESSHTTDMECTHSEEEKVFGFCAIHYPGHPQYLHEDKTICGHCNN